MFDSLFKKPEASRKYVDLIMQASSKWANWDPPMEIKAGDFGYVDKHTGEFRYKGSIYQDEETAAIAKGFPEQILNGENEYIVKSASVKQRNHVFGLHADFPPAADLAFSTEFKFGKRRGASLVMHRPKMHVVPKEFLQHMKIVSYFKKKQLSLVTQVFTCDGYVLYLSNKEVETVRLGLDAKVLASLSVSAGAKVDNAWKFNGHTGLLRHAYGEGRYTPLYSLTSLRPPSILRRGPTDPAKTQGDHWGEADVPWSCLDSDGEEEPEEAVPGDE